MTNPLARVVMQNVVKSTEGGRTQARGKKPSMKSLDELARGVKNSGGLEEKKEIRKDQPESPVRTMTFSDISKKARGGDLAYKELKSEKTSPRGTEKKSLDQVARDLKGQASQPKPSGKSKSLKFNDLIDRDRNIVEDSLDNIDSKDKDMIRGLIDGKSDVRTEVRTGKHLNLSQAVKSIINR